MSQKIAYVTGGMGGIGTAICQKLAKAGFKVIAGCGPSRDYQKWLDEQKALGFAFHASVGNVADWDSTVEAFQKANPAMRPNFMAVGGYDGMRVIYEALKATQGKGDGTALLGAMKGQIFESPRGQVFIDAQTRDIVQNVYLRKVEKKNGQLYNVEFDVIKDVKDPGKAR